MDHAAPLAISQGLLTTIVFEGQVLVLQTEEME